MQSVDSLEKTLMLGKIEGRRRRGWQRIRGLGGITNSMDISLSKLWKLVMDREAQPAAVMGSQSQTWLRDWNELKPTLEENQGVPCSGLEPKHTHTPDPRTPAWLVHKLQGSWVLCHVDGLIAPFLVSRRTYVIVSDSLGTWGCGRTSGTHRDKNFVIKIHETLAASPHRKFPSKTSLNTDSSGTSCQPPSVPRLD